MDFCEILITSEPIEVPPAAEFSGCGAVVDFFGVVRPLEDARPLAGIEYEGHPRMTEPTLRKLVGETARNHPFAACRLTHRIGFVPAGEVSLFLRVAAPHRQAAYDASREIVEQLKRHAPIWKNPIFAA